MSLHKIDNREEKLTTKKITKCLEISLFVYLFINIVASTVSAEMVIKIPRPVSDQDTRYRYGTELLRQALEKTRTKFGDYRIEMAKNKMPEKRMRAELKEGIRINVHHLTLMTMLNQDYAIPILVPTLKGTLGYRIFLIHKEDRQRFADIKTLEQFKKLVVGQGQGWGDVAIFEHNGIKVQTGASYEGLFSMLAAKRFDYFSRGIGEAPPEYQARKGKIPELWVEESILLIYPYPAFFYVHKKFPKIADRLNRGLHGMVDDGSFDKLFMRYNRDTIQKAKLKGRKVFKIETPNMPIYVPLYDPRLWYDPLSF